MSEGQRFEQWAVLELFGYTRVAGKVTEATIAGGSFIRLDVPGQDGEMLWTRFYNPSAVYSISPVSEEVATKMAANLVFPPVQPWELKQLPSPDETTEPAESHEE